MQLLLVLCILQELQEGTDLHQVLIGLVEDGQLAGAHTLAATLPQPYSVQLVRNCDRCGRLREAVDIVKHFNLEKVRVFRTTEHWGALLHGFLA